MSNENDVIYSNLSQVVPSFEGAGYTYREGMRGLFDGSADSLAARELRFLQNRSAHICRNNGYGKTALNKWVTNANHIKTIWKNKDGSLHKVMQGYWDEFIANPSFDGYGDYRVFQGVSNSSLFLTGNSYIRKLIIRTGNTNVVPLKLQLIPAALHDVLYTGTASTDTRKNIQYGMTFVNSIPTEYHFLVDPLKLKPYEAGTSHVTVPSEEIVHTFIRQEPAQWLGIPLLAPVILSLYALDDLKSSTINKQLAAQSIAVIVEQTANALNMLPVGAHTIENKTDYVNDGKTKTVFKNNPKESQTLYLNKGESAKMFQGTDIGNNFASLIEGELRKIAATLDLAYHELTGDAGALNYSSLQGIMVQQRNRLEYLHNFLFIPLREAPIASAFKDLAVVYNSKCASAVPYFQLPRWRGTDDLKDAQADLLEIQNGFGLLTEALTERGLTIEQVIADLEARKQLEEYGIVLNSAGSADSMRQTGNTEANSNSTGV
jgi:lambda family phage portal protein